MSDVGMCIAYTEEFENCGQSLNWYAIADSAQNDALPRRLLGAKTSVRCLFGYSQESPIAQFSPHLVALEPPRKRGMAWQWIWPKEKSNPCISLIATKMSFDELFAKLSKSTEVSLPDGDEMFLAFWDPAILGTLLGQEDDVTLHVKGPILTKPQKAIFLRGLEQWWYWDRVGALHKIIANDDCSERIDDRIFLNQEQVDGLVEASVPDHLLYYLHLNQPSLIEAFPVGKRYEQVRQSLMRARNIGLYSMRDLLNYVCAELFYGDRMEKDGEVIDLLRQVKNKKITFDNAIGNFP